MKRVALIGCTVALIAFTPLAYAENGKTTGNGGSHMMHQHMVDSAKESQTMKMSGDVDQDFATMMAHHHKSGIEMAEMYLKNSKDEELRELAQKMIKEQNKELETLKKHASDH